MIKQKKTILVAGAEIVLLMVITLPMVFIYPNVLKPIVNLLCFLKMTDAPSMCVTSIVLSLIGVWFLILLVWRQGNIYVKVALGYMIFFLCGFILFLRFIVPHLIGPF